MPHSHGDLLQVIKLSSHLIYQTVENKPIQKVFSKLIPSYRWKTKGSATNK